VVRFPPPWSVEELFEVTGSADQKLALMLFCLLPVMLRYAPDRG
jgi:hypothetical protein